MCALDCVWYHNVTVHRTIRHKAPLSKRMLCFCCQHPDIELSKLYSNNFNCCRHTQLNGFNLQTFFFLRDLLIFPDIYTHCIVPNFLCTMTYIGTKFQFHSLQKRHLPYQNHSIEIIYDPNFC